jgi:hypothetical protein
MSLRATGVSCAPLGLQIHSYCGKGGKKYGEEPTFFAALDRRRPGIGAGSGRMALQVKDVHLALPNWFPWRLSLPYATECKDVLPYPHFPDRSENSLGICCVACVAQPVAAILRISDFSPGHR